MTLRPEDYDKPVDQSLLLEDLLYEDASRRYQIDKEASSNARD